MQNKPIVRLSPVELMEFVQCELHNREQIKEIKDDHIRCFKNPDEIRLRQLVIHMIEESNLREKAIMKNNYEKFIKKELK